jgi:hypothetical protein
MAQNRLTPQQIAALARARGLDPQAVLAVARQEGLGGGIGDGGHAYGPFQLNNSGGVITKQYGGRVNDQGVQDWAWSPAGVNYALDGIAGVAKGLHGRQAINAIVSRFERPANPGREIAGALAAYGAGGPSQPQGGPLAVAAGSPTPAVAAASPVPQRDFRPQLASQLAAAAGSPTNDLRGFYSTVRQAILQRDQPQPSRGSVPAAPLPAAKGQIAPVTPLPYTPGKGVLPIRGNIGQEDPGFLAAVMAAARARGAVAIEATSGERSREHNAAVGGASHSNHLPDSSGNAHALDGYAILPDGRRIPLGQFLKPNAGKYGLRSGATFNWGGRPDLVHVDDFHNGGR